MGVMWIGSEDGGDGVTKGTGGQRASLRKGATGCLTIPPLPQHLQEALGLPAVRGDGNLEETLEDKGAWGTGEDGQGEEEEEEEEATPTPSSSPSPSPTPEDAVTYIRELP